MTMTPEDFSWAAELLDKAVSDGHLELDPSGAPVIPDVETVQAELEQDRQQRREESGASDTADQERLVLGFCTAGHHDHRDQWGEFRDLLGLKYSDEMPASLWTDKQARWVAQEIDATYRNRRGIQLISGGALIESMREQIASKLSSASLQEFSQAVASIETEVEGVPASDFRISAEILRTRWGRSKITRLGESLIRSTRREVDVTKVLEECTTELQEARDIFSGRIGNSYAFSSAEDGWFLVEQAVNREHCAPTPTGILSLDMDIQGGVKANDAGKMHLIGARTGIGKSTLGIAAAGGLCANGAHVLFLSCELNDTEIQARFMANYSRHMKEQGRMTQDQIDKLPQWRLEGRGKVKPQGFDESFFRLMECMQEDKAAGKGSFTAYCQFLAEADDFVEVIRAAKAKTPAISAVFLDHFHALRPTSKGPRDRSQEMEVRAQILHGAAKECEVDLFVLCQLNRGAADDPKGPQAIHINGTDALAQLASAVWLMEFKKPDPEAGEQFDRGRLTLVHGKGRNGQRLPGDDSKAGAVSCDESILKLERDYCWIEHDHPQLL